LIVDDDVFWVRINEAKAKQSEEDRYDRRENNDE
jgi:hypothetical protein